jgi:hypothetical protein
MATKIDKLVSGIEMAINTCDDVVGRGFAPSVDSENWVRQLRDHLLEVINTYDDEDEVDESIEQDVEEPVYVATEAGFDLSEIYADVWEKGLKKHNLTGFMHDEDKGFFWFDENSENFVVTANNPISGEYYYPMRSPEADYTSYVGIEGTPEFVSAFFKWFKENATYIKNEEFGKRSYI